MSVICAACHATAPGMCAGAPRPCVPVRADDAPEPTPEGFLVPPLAEWFDDHHAAALNFLGGLAPRADGESAEMLVAHKLTTVINVPDDLLMDMGFIPDTREHRPVPWRWRLRWKVGAWRDRAARRAYKIIAGDWPDDGEDYRDGT